MGYAPRSGAVIVLCIGAVVLATILFPAAGMGGLSSASDGTNSGVLAGTEPGQSLDDQDSPADASTADGTEPTDEETNGSASDGEINGSASDGETNGSASDEATNASGSDVTDPDGEPSNGDETITRLGQFLGVVLLPLTVAGFVLAVSSALSDSRTGLFSVGSDPLPDGPLPRLRMLATRIPQLSMIATIGVARQAVGLGDAFVSLGESVAEVGLLAGSGVRTALLSVTTVSVGLPSILRPRFPAIRWPSRSASTTSRSDSASTNTSPNDPGEGESYGEPDTVEEAWRRLVVSLPLRRPSVRTPRECAAFAVDTGLPADAIETLTDVFEAVRYGGAARTPDRLERVRKAYARVREARRGDGQ